MFFYSLASGHLISSALKVISFKHGAVFRTRLDFFSLWCAAKQKNLLFYMWHYILTYSFCTNNFKPLSVLPDKPYFVHTAGVCMCDGDKPDKGRKKMGEE